MSRSTNLVRLAAFSLFFAYGCNSPHTPPTSSSPATTRGVVLSVSGDEELQATRDDSGIRELHTIAVTDEGLSLERWPQLRVLNLALCQEITDKGLKSIGHLKELRYLNLIETGITDKTIERLSALPALDELYVGATSVTGKGIGKLVHLRTLSFTDAPQITDDSLSELPKLSQLRCLRLNGTQVSDKGLATITNMATLRDLRLASSDISDRGLVHVAKLRGLLRLNLYDTRVTDEGIAALLGLDVLEELSLGQTVVTDRGALQLARLPRLRRLWLTGTHVTLQAMEKLQRSMPNVEFNPPRPLGDVTVPLDERILAP